MENKVEKVNESWLNGELKSRIRNTYEPRYNRILSEKEVITIANNLVSLIEHFLKFKRRIDGI